MQKYKYQCRDMADEIVKAAWQARAQISKPQPTSKDAERFYDLGFKASGEGHNGEHGANITGEYYLTKRKEAIEAAMKEGK